MAIEDTIREQINTNSILLYMKGSPEAPQCGFSAQVAYILKQAGATYDSFNVLSDPAVWEGVKEYGEWPTIPQLYVDGKLVGGCDITMELAEKGELNKVLGV